jgi:hypothetical protein
MRHRARSWTLWRSPDRWRGEFLREEESRINGGDWLLRWG